MKASIDLSTGLMHEYTGDGVPDSALIATAVAGGVMLGNIEIRSVTQAEVDALSLARVPFSQRVADAIAKTYADVDVIYASAIGNRAEEYRQAESAATAYLANGTPSEYVSAWALSNPPMTDTQSAEAIVARATALRSAMVAVRTQRFTSQAAMRAASDQAGLDAAVSTWGTFIIQTRSALA